MVFRCHSSCSVLLQFQLVGQVLIFFPLMSVGAVSTIRVLSSCFQCVGIMLLSQFVLFCSNVIRSSLEFGLIGRSVLVLSQIGYSDFVPRCCFHNSGFIYYFPDNDVVTIREFNTIFARVQFSWV